MRLPFLAMAAVLISSSFLVQAKMFKWVDENGQMHFGDEIPQKYQVKEHEELNDRGVSIKQLAAAKTPEEKAEERRLEKERKNAVHAEEKQKKLDRELLDIYSTERDLIVARDSRLDAIATQVEMSEAIINASNKKIESMEKQVIDIKAEKSEVPIYLYNRIDSEKQQVAVQNRVMSKHKKRGNEILEKYNGYIERFRVVRPH
jgi:hypothetical protein